MKKLQNKNINTKEYWNAVFSSEIILGTTRIESERFEKAAQMIVDNSVVLDAGCGRGEFVKYLKTRKPGCNITGVDISDAAIADAKKKQPNCNFRSMDVYDIPKRFTEYDYVVSFETLEHLSEPEKFIFSIHQVLKKNGFAIITLPYDDMVYGGDEHMYSFTFQDILTMFNAPDWQLIVLIRYSLNFKNMFIVAKKV